MPRARSGASGRALWQRRQQISLVALLVGINALRFSYPTTTPLLGWNLSTRTVPYLEELPANEEPLRSTLIAARNRSLVAGESHTGLLYIWPVRRELEAANGSPSRALDERMVLLNLGLIAHHPLDYAATVASSAGTYVSFAATDDDRLNST